MTHQHSRSPPHSPQRPAIPAEPASPPPFDANGDEDQDAPAPGSSERPDWQAVMRHALFEGASLDGLHATLDRCAIRELGVGQVLLAPGQVNRTLFLVLDGQLKAHIDHIDSEEGFVIGPGECMGEISVIDAKPASAFVVAETPSRVLAIADEDLWGGLLRDPRIARNFMRLFAERFRSRTEMMRQALEQQLRYQHLQKELAIAQEIQLGMLPRDQDLDLGPEIDLAVEIMPAQLVGGDFYDVISITEDEYAIVVGDVSGKGVPAALFMVRTLTILRTELLKGQPIEDALRNVNTRLCEENAASMFATLVAAVINKRTGHLRYINAGHDAILFAEGGQGYRPLPPPSGIMIGVEETASYGVESRTLAHQDVLVLYTDGTTEAMDRTHRLFTLDRLTACLEAQPTGSAQGLADAVTSAVKQFSDGAPQSDDLTLLVLRYLGT